MMPIDIAELRRLWADPTVRTVDIACRLGCSQVRLYQLRRKHGIPSRKIPRGGIRDWKPIAPVFDDGDPEPPDSTPGDGTLALDPWVARRATAKRLAYFESIGCTFEDGE